MSKTSAPRGACVRVLGMTVYSFELKGNRAHSLPAARGIPNLAHQAGIPVRLLFGPALRPCSSALLFGPALRLYSSARRSRSRDRTVSGTRPLTSPPYLAISLTRLELRKE